LRRFGEMAKAELKSWYKSKATGRTGPAAAREKALSTTSS
jgi:hypothetical protein